MEYVTLGRTGLRVSVAGLGCGGHSRLGQSYGLSRSDSLRVLEEALDLGINVIDTAAAYGTEEIVGEAVRARRDSVVLSTKVRVVARGASPTGSTMVDPAAFGRDIEASLGRLRTSHIDILHLHGVMPDQYDYCIEMLLPVLDRFRGQGKVRFLGLTERFIHDPQHRMLVRALDDTHWDVVMTGFNVINPSAAARVLAPARARHIGTLVMFAVRRALSDPEALMVVIDDLLRGAVIERDAVRRDNPLGFLVELGGARSIVDGAYRFCRHQAGVDVVLTGTGRVDHLAANVSSLLDEPLAAPCLERLHVLFGAVDSVSGN